ncbi:MAG: hypothetical protein CMJ84_08185 [Planctomycetes bacterium]|jgi:hypothetical protein|nr:hypothetical protein [Planctomycetota bacterium]MDP6407767.1 hypothetical protein [Planctomycetota bacterium]
MGYKGVMAGETRTWCWNAALALACLTAEGAAQTLGVDEPFLMSVTSCGGSGCNNPQQHQVTVAESSDGVAWHLLDGWGGVTYQGSVPDVLRRGQTLYVFTPNEVARYELDSDTWLPPAPVALDDPDTTGGFVDPSATLDEQGRIVLFYLLGIIGSDPAGCNGAPTCTKYIHSATEVPGSDGTAFVVNPGHRLAVAVGGSNPPIASDPDLLRLSDGFGVLLSRGTSTQLWRASELHGTYALSPSLPGGFLWQNGPAVASGTRFAESGEFWLYAHQFSPSHGTQVVRRAVVATLDQAVPAAAWTTVCSASDLGGGAAVELGSPGFALNVPGAVGTPLCFGDGGGTPCPCGNDGAGGEGCRNTGGTGCVLAGSGTASVVADTVVLTAAGALGTQAGLFFQGNEILGGGDGITFGDGLRCCGTQVVRLQIVFPDSGGTAASSAPLAVGGGALAGDTLCYQFWYRDPNGGGVCGAGFNLSNACSVAWTP